MCLRKEPTKLLGLISSIGSNESRIEIGATILAVALAAISIKEADFKL